MADPRVLIHAPPGEPGSGRVRYGAAMALHRQGLLTEAQLEAYRVASAHDGRDPAALLADLGLPVPPRAESDPVARLTGAVARYVGGLRFPGQAEVRRGLARALAAPPRAVVPRGSPVAETWLPAALAPLSATHPDLSRAIGEAAPRLAWGTYDAYPPDRIGPAFAAGHAFASLVGADAPHAAEDYDLGLFLIAPHVLYRDHAHPAPELYAPLTGPHGWRFGPGRPLHRRPAHRPVWNEPMRPHLTLAGAVPFLAVYCWTRDVDRPAVVLDAGDWPALEAARPAAD